MRGLIFVVLLASLDAVSSRMWNSYADALSNLPEHLRDSCYACNGNSECRHICNLDTASPVPHPICSLHGKYIQFATQHNYGTCGDCGMQRGWHCFCDLGWTGPTCDQNANECAPRALYPDPNSCGDITVCETAVTQPATNNCVSPATCVDTVGSFVCACPVGLNTTAASPNACSDIDECSLGIHSCTSRSTCANSIGSFSCICKTGFALNSSATVPALPTGADPCQDVDECALNLHNCAASATCENNVGSFQCSCGAGYQSTANLLGCSDVNECATASHSCEVSASYRNTVGSFSCTCGVGYGLGSSGRSCGDLNECALHTHQCDASARCTNTVGSFECSCDTGLSFHGSECLDINECGAGTHSCAVSAVCVNSAGSFTCSCNSGYASTNGNTACAEINECVTGAHSCATITAVCTNTPGSFTCSCRSGYTGSGTNCTDINECDTSAHTCATNSLCRNSAGSFSCQCRSGFSQASGQCSCTPCPKGTYSASGWDCVECQANTFSDVEGSVMCEVCPPGMVSAPRSASCSCPPGWMNPSSNCTTDIDECVILNGNNCDTSKADCVNTLGSFICQPNSKLGPRLSPDDESEGSGGLSSASSMIIGVICAVFVLAATGFLVHKFWNRNTQTRNGGGTEMRVFPSQRIESTAPPASLTESLNATQNRNKDKSEDIEMGNGKGTLACIEKEN